MIRTIFGVFLLVGLGMKAAWAIENESTGTYNETAPTASNIPQWISGWAQPTVQPAGYTYTTGWNYVGMVNGSGSQASGVYLGGGWVLTAAHVGLGTFTLNGANYPPVANSAQYITAQTGTTTAQIDVMLFQISPFPALPALVVSTTEPTAYSTRVAMIGYGDGGQKTNETWGCNTVTDINQSISPSGMPWVSNDFLTLTGESSDGSSSVTNNYQVVSGDSGGGDFSYDSANKRWELAGINEVTGTATFSNGSTQAFSGFVQLSTYATQIAQITQPIGDSPAMPAWAVVLLGTLLLLVGCTRPSGRRGIRL